MVCASVRSIIPSLKLGDYLFGQVHKPCSISHIVYEYHSNCMRNKISTNDDIYCFICAEPAINKPEKVSKGIK